MTSTDHSFSMIGADIISELIEKDRRSIFELIKQAYCAFGQGAAVNPHSSFLRFNSIEAQSLNRIIALPAILNASNPIAGMKWISSFPGNIEHGINRASAVLILNDINTGFPIACLESSLISAARTAASAVLGAEVLTNGTKKAQRIGFVGNGVISSTIFDFFNSLAWSFDEISVFDLDKTRSEKFKLSLEKITDVPIKVDATLPELLTSCDLIVFATTSGTPYVDDPALFAHHPNVLHISLRDLSPEIILASENLVDDTDHCLRANTSLDLAEKQSGNREFVTANIYDCLGDKPNRGWSPVSDRPKIFSPFGMGILDLAIGEYIHRVAKGHSGAMNYPTFHPQS